MLASAFAVHAGKSAAEGTWARSWCLQSSQRDCRPKISATLVRGSAARVLSVSAQSL